MFATIISLIHSTILSYLILSVLNIQPSVLQIQPLVIHIQPSILYIQLLVLHIQPSVLPWVCEGNDNNANNSQENDYGCHGNESGPRVIMPPDVGLGPGRSPDYKQWLIVGLTHSLYYDTTLILYGCLDRAHRTIPWCDAEWGGEVIIICTTCFAWYHISLSTQNTQIAHWLIHLLVLPK